MGRVFKTGLNEVFLFDFFIRYFSSSIYLFIKYSEDQLKTESLLDVFRSRILAIFACVMALNW